MNNFERAFAIVVGEEGGYVNDPRDPGGETKFGITKRDHPERDIFALTLDDAREIYRSGYWDEAKCDQFAWPLCAYVFDAAVNQDPEVALKLLQKTVGVKQDGSWGPTSAKRLAKCDPKETALLYLADRALRYTGTRNFDHFGRGWLKRLFVLCLAASV